MHQPAPAPRLHVVLVAPPWYPVPPRGYGGIELVVGQLAAELRRRGHRVTLIGAQGSQPQTVVLAPAAWSHDLGTPDERLRELAYAARVGDHLRSLAQVDVVHDHGGGATLLAATMCGRAPVVHTVHGRLRGPDIDFLRSLDTAPGLVAISGSQRAAAPRAPWIGTVHNAVDVHQLAVGSASEREPYLLCLARICRDKGQHTAIEVARRVGMRLVLAGKVERTRDGEEYHRRAVAPHVDGDRVIHVHNVVGAEKARLLARARALLAPIEWDEPFGLAVVEAMASGTPAIVMRRGAAPELVEQGITGFLVDNVDEMAAAVGLVDVIEPERCAQITRRRFSSAAMTDGYLALYGTVVTPRPATTMSPVSPALRSPTMAAAPGPPRGAHSAL